MNYEERIKELISKNNKLGRTNIELNQTIKERNEVGKLKDRLYKAYSS